MAANQNNSEGFIPVHGGYRNLLTYKKAEIMYDGTIYFCRRIFIGLIIILGSTSGLWAQDSTWFTGSPFFKMQFTPNSFYISTSDTLLGGLLDTNAGYTDVETGITFFTGGKKLHNNYYELVENGDSLVYDSLVELYITEPEGSFVGQGAIFIPVPGDNNKCYLFQQTLNALFYPDSVHEYWLPNKICYQLIDMSANNNHGKIVKKNIVMFNSDTLVTGLTAVKAANGSDYWLFAHGYNSDIYYRWLITGTDIEGPYTQHIGFKMDTILSWQDFGSAIFSNDGNYFVYAGKLLNEVELYDFDRCSGLLSNRRIDSIPVPYLQGVYSAYFSPDSKHLFVNSLLDLYEYEIDSPDFSKSRIFIDSADNYNEGGGQAGFGRLMLGPNNVMYLSTYNGTHTLHRILNPNKYGIPCNLQQHFDSIPGATASLPNMPNYHLTGLPVYTATAGNDTLIHPRDTIQIGSSLNNPVFIYQWSPSDGLDNTASPHPRCYPSITTIYKVMVTDTSATYSCNTTIDSIKVTVDSLNGIININPLRTSIYPVPTSNKLYITFNEKLKGDYIIEVYNSVGQLMSNFGLIKNNYAASISTTNFANGFYLLRVIQNGNAVYKNTFEVFK